jgi:hypothetical protein
MGRMSASDAGLIADWLLKNEVTRPTKAQAMRYADAERHTRAEFAADDKAYYDRRSAGGDPIWDPINNCFAEGSSWKRYSPGDE